MPDPITTQAAAINRDNEFIKAFNDVIRIANISASNPTISQADYDKYKLFDSSLTEDTAHAENRNHIPINRDVRLKMLALLGEHKSMKDRHGNNCIFAMANHDRSMLSHNKMDKHGREDIALKISRAYHYRSINNLEHILPDQTEISTLSAIIHNILILPLQPDTASEHHDSFDYQHSLDKLAELITLHTRHNPDAYHLLAEQFNDGIAAQVDRWAKTTTPKQADHIRKKWARTIMDTSCLCPESLFKKADHHEVIRQTYDQQANKRGYNRLDPNSVETSISHAKIRSFTIMNSIRSNPRFVSHETGTETTANRFKRPRIESLGSSNTQAAASSSHIHLG